MKVVHNVPPVVYLDPPPPQTFKFIAGMWRVEPARKMAADKEPTDCIDPKPWADQYLGPELLPGEEYELDGQRFGMIGVNEHHALSEHIDLTEPVIMICMKDSSGQSITYLPIDGWHRIWRGRHDGVDKLPVIVLDEREERVCRVYGDWDKPIKTRKGDNSRP